MTEIRFREQKAGQECAERHRHAGALHQQGRAEHDQQRRRRHHFARSGIGELFEKRIEQIAAGEHDQRDRPRHPGHRHQRFGPGACMLLAARRQQGEQREQRHDGDVLKQQDRDRALRIGLLHRSALFQDLQGDGRRGQSERDTHDQRAAPIHAGEINEPENSRRGDDQLRCAEPQNIAAHRQQTPHFEFKPDQEHQHDNAELGDRQHLLGGRENAEPERPDHRARDEISHDGREAEPARNRHADDSGGEQRQRQGKKSRLTVGSAHAEYPSDRRAARAHQCDLLACHLHQLSCPAKAGHPAARV